MRKVLKAILKILQFLAVAIFVILFVLAVAGAVVALFGAVAGLENVKIIGETVSGIGTFGFFVLLLSPVGKLLAGVFEFLSWPEAQSNVNETGPSSVDAGGKKESIE